MRGVVIYLAPTILHNHLLSKYLAIIITKRLFGPKFVLPPKGLPRLITFSPGLDLILKQTVERVLEILA